MSEKLTKKSYAKREAKTAANPVAGGDSFQIGCADMLDALPFYVLLVDEQHHIVMANRAVTDQLGVKPKDILGCYCPEAIHGTKEPWPACPLEAAVKKNEAVVLEAQDQKTGRWINSAIYPIPGLHRGKKIFFHKVTDITDRKLAEEQLKTSREQLRELSNHLETVREEERTSIAREIHDELGQTLVTLKIYISWLLRRLSKAEELASEQTKSIYALIDAAINTVMRLSTQLRPGALDDFGLASAIEWQINEFKKWTDLEYDFVSVPRNIVLDREIATAFYRIAHEALTNIIRHAQATQVRILLKKTRRVLELSIKDNGNGITEAQINDPRAFGLVGMRERAHLLGGELQVSGVPGEGTIVKITLSLRTGQEEAAKTPGWKKPSS
jgi:PAS domain S-box-containing protein